MMRPSHGVVRAVTPGAAAALSFWFALGSAHAESQLVHTPVNGSGPDLEFGTVRSATTSPALNVTLTNNGPDNANNIQYTFTDGINFSISGEVNSLNNGASDVFSVNCNPLVPGDYSTTLSITWNTGGTQPRVIDIHCFAPAMWVDPAAVSFGDQLVLSTSTAQTVTITNDMATPQNITNYTFGGTNPGDFDTVPASPSFPIALAAAASTTIDLTFTPAARLGRSAVFTVVDNVAAVPNSTMNLSGTGRAPVISVQAGTLAFGSRRINTSSPTQQFTISNNGDAGYDLDVTSIAIPVADDDEDYIVTPSSSLSIAAGTSINVSVTFHPVALGAQDATISIEHNDPLAAAQSKNCTGTGVTANLGFSEDPEPFGSVVVGSSSTRAVTLQNTPATNGDVLTVTGLSIGGTDSTYFTLVTPPALPFNIPAGGTQNINVRCSPTIAKLGALTATLTVTSNADDGASQAVGLTCTSVRPYIQVSDTSAMAFGDVPWPGAGVTWSPTRTITNQNNANAGDLSITAMSIDNARFTITGIPAPPFTLAPGASQNFDVVFDPNADGPQSGTLTITSNDPNTPSITWAVSGNGVSPEFQKNAPAGTSINFGDVQVSSTSAAIPVTVQNIGTSDLTINSAGFAAATTQFSFTNGSGASAAPFTIAPTGTATWNIVCHPTSTGAKSATFRVTHDDPDGTESPMDIILSCNGTQAALTVSPSPINFIDTNLCTTRDLLVTLTNSGTASLTVNSITTSNSEFILVAPPTTPLVLGPSATQNLTVRFAPTVAGARSADLTVTHTAPGSPTVRTMSGNGTVAAMSLSDNSYDFGDVRIDQTYPTHDIVVSNPLVANAGVFTLQTASLASSADFDLLVVGGNPPRTINPGQSVTLRVTANPTTLGAKSDTLNITTSIPMACPSPATAAIPLAANGVVPDVSIAPGSVAFGPRDVQAAPAELPVTISNSGTAPLEISDIQISGTDAPRFSFASNTLPFTIPVASSAVVDVTYTPVVAGVNHMASMRVISDAQSGPTMDVPLTGRGIDRIIVVDPASLTFPPTYRNSTPATLTVNIRNDGEAVLAINMVSRTGGGENAFTVGDNVPATIDGQSMAPVTIEFAPTSAGSYMADLLISNDDDQEPTVVVPMSGTGVVPNFMPVTGVCDVGRIGVGVPTRVTTGNCEDGVQFTNMEPVAFQISDVRLVDMDGNEYPETMFRVVDFQVSEAEAGEVVSFDVEVTANVEVTGNDPVPIQATLELYVGTDPLPVSQVTITAQAVEVELRGGGGCDGGGGRGSALTALLLLGLAALGRVRRLRAGVVVLVVAAGLAAAAPARAERTRNLDLATFRPAPGVETELITIETPKVGPSGAWMLGLFFNHAINPLTLSSPQVAEGRDSLVAGRTAFELAFSYALANRYEVGLLVPMLQQSGDQGMVVQGVPPADGFSLGDVAVHAKASLIAAEPFSLGASATVTAPTATDGEFAGVDGPTGHLRGLLGIHTGRIQLAANGGFRVRKGGQFGDLDQGNELTYGLGSAYRVSRSLWAVGELFGAFGVGGAGSSKGVSPLEAGLAMRWRMSRAMSVAGGAGAGLQPGIGSPDARAFVLVTYAPSASPVPDLPRPRGPVVDRGDDDGDKIVNADDGCVDEAEDFDKFKDEDGCPEPDNDEDGFPDDKDPCPVEREDKDGFKDDDGCIDGDNDEDKIADAQDKCPDEPEDLDGFQDRDGCDDPDNDGDGIPDVIDQCATETETINGNKDDDGCADPGDSLVMVMPDRIEVFEPVRFDGKTAKIVRKSENALAQVAATLRANRDFIRVRIAVHVHPRGGEDQQLSERRAQAVKKWLTTWGIEPERLEVKGYGSNRPLVPASKKGAADVNDRVEFILLEKKVK